MVFSMGFPQPVGTGIWEVRKMSHMLHGAGIFTYIPQIFHTWSIWLWGGWDYSSPPSSAGRGANWRSIGSPLRCNMLVTWLMPPREIRHTAWEQGIIDSTKRLGYHKKNIWQTANICIYPSIKPSIHPYMHPSIHPYMHTCIHAYMPWCLNALMPYITLHYIT